ncbi:MAG: hypothetical protein CFE40_04100 [Burkholderiales bacterium PBB1]|nr:MAG: hypothetical protein CFE40_04100 [Burkholderiales bacterium PBB1]
MKLGRWRLAAAAASAVLSMWLLGCAVPTHGSDVSPGRAMPAPVAADEAAIYVIRSERVGGAIPIEVLIDGKHVGATVARSYLYAVVAPGVRVLESRGDIRSTLEVDAKPGAITYVSQVVELQYLTSPRTRLRVVHAAQGREWVAELKPAPPR